MSSCDNSNIKQNYIVINTNEFETITACTGIWTSNIYGCSPITVQDQLKLNVISNDNTLNRILVIDNITGLVQYRDINSIISGTSGISDFTYDNENTFTITDTSGNILSATIDVMSGLTVNGNLTVTGDTSLKGLTASTISATTYQNLPDNVTGNYLPLSGGTVTGVTYFTSGLIITGDTIIKDSSNFNNVDTFTRELYDNLGNVSLNWDGRAAYDSTGNVSIEWEGKAAYDGAGMPSLSWELRTDYDSSSNVSLDWENRRAYDSVGNVSLDWENGILTGQTNIESSTISATTYLNLPETTKYFGSFYDTTDQTGVAGSILSMSANTPDSWNNGITCTGHKFYIAIPGVYNLAFSAQMVKTGGNSATHAHIWLSQNGLDVPNSGSQIGFPSNSYVVVAWNFFFETTTPNEYVSLLWEINSNVDNQLFIKSQPPSGNVPAIPSLIVTINQVD